MNEIVFSQYPKRLIIFLILVFSLLLNGCSLNSSSPEKVIEKFFYSVENGDIQSAINLMDNEFLDVPSLTRYMEGVTRNMASNGGIKEIKVTAPERGGEGMYKAFVAYRNGKIDDSGLIRIKKNSRGDWIIGQLR